MDEQTGRTDGAVAPDAVDQQRDVAELVMLDALAVLQAAVVEASAIGDVYEAVAEGARLVANAGTSVVNLVDEVGETFVTVAASGLSADRLVGHRMPADQCLSGVAYASGRVELVAEAADDGRAWQPGVWAGHVGPAMIMPLGSGAAAVGVIGVYRGYGAVRFSEPDVRAMEKFTTHAALTVQAAQRMLDPHAPKLTTVTAPPFAGDDAPGDDARPLTNLSDARIWAMVESAPDGLIMVDEGGVVLVVNRQIESMFGYDRGELLGRTIETLLPDQHRQVHTAHRTRYRVEPKVRTMGAGLDLWARRRDGSEFPVEISLSPIADGEGVAVMASVRDISDRVAVDAAARGIRRGIDSIRDGVYMIDPDTMGFTYVNEGAVAQTGHTTMELLDGMTPLHFAPEFTAQDFSERLRPLVEGTETAIGFETTLRPRSGLDFPIEVVMEFPDVDANDRQVFVAVVRDISERVEAERRVKLIQDSIDAVSDAVFVCDEHTLEFMHVNEGAVNLHGYSREELLAGMTPADLAPDLPPEAVAAALGQMVSDPDGSVQLTTEGVRKDGRFVSVDVRLNWPLAVSEGDPRPVVAVVRDITTQVEADARVRSSESRFRAAFDEGPVPMVVVAVTGRVIVEVNEAMVDLSGHQREELVGKSMTDLVHPDDQPPDDSSAAAIAAGEEFIETLRMIRADGATIWVRVHVAPLEGHSDQTTVIAHLVDVTAEEMADKARRRQEAFNEGLSKVRFAMLEGASRAEGLALACEAAKVTLEASTAYIVTPTGSGDELQIEAAVGLAEEARAKLSFNATIGLVGEVYRTGQVQLTGADDRRIPAHNQRVVREHRAGSILVAPLLGGDAEVLGAILAARHERAGPLDQTDLDAIVAFASQAVIAIEVAALRDAQARTELLEDRERIGRDIHDKVIGRLFSTGMTIQAALASVADDASRDRLGGAVDEIDEAIKEIRSAVYGVGSQVD